MKVEAPGRVEVEGGAAYALFPGQLQLSTADLDLSAD
jgi:hypothetical protein